MRRLVFNWIFLGMLLLYLPRWTNGQGAFSHLTNSWLWNRSGYSASFYGTNPPLADIHAQIRILATRFDVPVEIIGAVGYQESGLFQYGSDDFLVHNICEDVSAFAGEASSTQCSVQKPPGLGMFQLTGSTARQFDINRLISDWKYNLEAGVRVLHSKYEAALSSDPAELKALERSNRRILENWVYALEFYHGYDRSGPSYSHIILGHIKNPPARLATLFNAVTVSRPEAVISGFTWGKAYVALPNGKWKDSAGEEFDGEVHLTAGGAPLVPPYILAPPAPTVATLGSNARFRVSASGTGPLTYQWRKNGSSVGGDSTELNLSGVSQSDSGSYSVLVAGPGGRTASPLATLTVNAAEALRIVDGIHIVEQPPYFIGDSLATVDVTIKNVSATPVSLDRLQVEGEFWGSGGALLNTVAWNAETFPQRITIPPNGTHRHLANHTQNPFPFTPATVTARLKVKLSGIPGLKVISDADPSATAVLTFETVNKYELTVEASPHGTFIKAPDATHYGHETEMLLEAVPTQGYIFEAWKLSDGSTFSPQNPVMIVMTRNLGLRAQFAPLTPRINLRALSGIAHLTWPDWGTAFILQGAANTTPAVWRNIDISPTLRTSLYEAVIPVNAEVEIFRLQRP